MLLTRLNENRYSKDHLQSRTSILTKIISKNNNLNFTGQLQILMKQSSVEIWQLKMYFNLREKIRLTAMPMAK